MLLERRIWRWFVYWEGAVSQAAQHYYLSFSSFWVHCCSHVYLQRHNKW